MSSSNDYGTYKPPKSPKSPRAARNNPGGALNKPSVPPPVPSASGRRSSSRADEAPKSPRSPRSPRLTPVSPVVVPASSWGGGTDASRYEPLVGNDDDNSSGCPNCGTNHRKRARFCDECGYSLRGQSKAAALFDTSDWAFNPARYGLFGWLETILGVIGLAMGFGSLFAYQNPGEPLTSLRTAEAVMVGLMLALQLLLALQRFFYKELFAFCYAVLAMGGSICALIVVLLHTSRPGTFFVVYFFAWAVAMGVKMFWLCCADLGPTSQFKMEQHTFLDEKWKIWLLTALMCLMAFLGFVLQLVILTTTFEEQ